MAARGCVRICGDADACESGRKVAIRNYSVGLLLARQHEMLDLVESDA